MPVDAPQRRRPDIGHTLSLLGWSPVTELSDGLKQTIDWFRANREDIETAEATG